MNSRAPAMQAIRRLDFGTSLRQDLIPLVAAIRCASASWEYIGSLAEMAIFNTPGTDPNTYRMLGRSWFITLTHDF